jgi:hypothetical protein
MGSPYEADQSTWWRILLMGGIFDVLAGVLSGIGTVLVVSNLVFDRKIATQIFLTYQVALAEHPNLMYGVGSLFFALALLCAVVSPVSKSVAAIATGPNPEAKRFAKLLSDIEQLKVCCRKMRMKNSRKSTPRR